MVLSPAVMFLAVLIIGIVVGIAFDRFMGPGWLTRQIAGGTRHALTSALVGIAGAFIGWHLAVLAVLGSPAVALIAAAVGAAIVLFVWKRV